MFSGNVLLLVIDTITHYFADFSTVALDTIWLRSKSNHTKMYCFSLLRSQTICPCLCEHCDFHCPIHSRFPAEMIFNCRSLSKQPVHVFTLRDKRELKTYAYLFEIQQSLILTPLRFGSLAQANQVGKQFACRLD